MQLEKAFLTSSSAAPKLSLSALSSLLVNFSTAQRSAKASINIRISQSQNRFVQVNRLQFSFLTGQWCGLDCETGGGTIQPETPKAWWHDKQHADISVDRKHLLDYRWMEAEIDAVVRYMKESRPLGAELTVAG